jgi:hypothetical protein
MKHTQGKWNLFIQDDNGFGITNGDSVIAIAGEGDLPENEANANLIAAAPELIEALQSINDLEVDFGFSDRQAQLQDWARKVGRIAREAIAKAEGGE